MPHAGELPADPESDSEVNRAYHSGANHDYSRAAHSSASEFLRRKQSARRAKPCEAAAGVARAARAAVEREQAWQCEREAREERAKRERQSHEAHEAPWSRKAWAEPKTRSNPNPKTQSKRRTQRPESEAKSPSVACQSGALPDEALARLNAEAAKGGAYLLVHVYAQHPPPRGGKVLSLPQLKQDLKRALRAAARDYHPDNSSAHVPRPEGESTGAGGESAGGGGGESAGGGGDESAASALYLEIPKLINAIYCELFRAKAGFDETWSASGTHHGA